MQYVNCKKISRRYYYPVESTDDHLKTLAIFFTDGTSFDFYKKWAENTSSDLVESPVCVLKKNGESIEITVDQKLFDQPPAYRISITDFVRLIDEWKALAYGRASTIVMTKELGVVTLKGYNIKTKTDADYLKTPYCCERIKRTIEDKDSPFEYSPIFREYSLRQFYNRVAVEAVHSCPWCAYQFLESVRDDFFDIVCFEYGIHDAYPELLENKKLPKEFMSNAWWKKRGL